VVWGPRDG